MLKKSTRVKIENAEYDVKFPTVGQMLDIENMKMSLTDNNYSMLLRSGLKTSFFATELVDAIAHFWILIPELRNDLTVKHYSDLDPFLAKKLVKVFRKQFSPWYDVLMDELLKDDEEVVASSEEEIEDAGDINLN